MLTEGGVLTADTETLRIAARAMLTTVLSCRDNMTDSGPVARIAGDTVGAAQFLPTMATEEFLSCLSKTAIERAAAAEEVRVEARGKDTRAQLIARFKDATYVYPAARFKMTDADLAKAARRAPYRFVPGSAEVVDDTNSTSEEDGTALDNGSGPEPECEESADSAGELGSAFSRKPPTNPDACTWPRPRRARCLTLIGRGPRHDPSHKGRCRCAHSHAIHKPVRPRRSCRSNPNAAS